MGKQHRILKKARLLQQYEYLALEIKDLCHNWPGKLDSLKIKDPAPMGFYKLATKVHQLQSEIKCLQEEQEDLIRQIIWFAGVQGLDHDKLKSIAILLVPECDRTLLTRTDSPLPTDWSYTPFRFLNQLSYAQLTRLRQATFDFGQCAKASVYVV